MTDETRENIAQYISHKKGIPLSAALDTVEYIEQVVYDTILGETEYHNIVAIMRDYGLPAYYSRFFYTVERYKPNE